MRKPKEVERFRPALPSAGSAFGGVSSKFQDPGLLFVQPQAELGHPIPQSVEERQSFPACLEPDNASSAYLMTITSPSASRRASDGSANLTRLDDWTRSLLTNKDVIEIDQSSSHGRRAAQEAQIAVWTAEGPAGSRYLALFNLGDEETKVAHDFDFYELPSGSYRLRDLWAGTDLPAAGGIRATIPPHGVLLYRLVHS